MKIYIAVIFCALLMASCKFAERELPNTQELLRRELHTIDWSKVDTYPSYPSCDTIKNNEDTKICFFDRLNFETLRVLKNDSLVKISTIDSVQFLVTVSNDSKLLFKTQSVDEKLLPKWMLDSIMLYNVKQFSKIQPATKRGIPVTTEFDLHLKLHASSD